MKKIILLPVVALFTLLAFRSVNSGPIKIGDSLPNPELKMKDVTEKMVSMKDAMKENGLLVMFSCNTCPYVIKNQDRTTAAITAATAGKVGCIILNSNDAQRDGADGFGDMQQYAKDQGYTGKAWYVLDENAAQADAFGANRTPECFLFNKEGKLVYHGAIDDNPQDAANVSRKHLQTAIDEMTAGKEVTVKVSRSVGCTIKRKS